MSSLENKIKRLIDNNILYLPQLSEEERREFKHIKLPEDLEELHCNFRELKELPTLPHLKILDCGRNQLKKLPTLPDSLEVLICDDNYYELHNQTTGRVQFIRTLSTLPKLPRLKVLICNANNIHHIPSLPDSLEVLNCSGNPNEHLPLLPKSLKEFECYNQQLKEPYASFVRIDNMKDRINSIRYQQLTIIGTDLKKVSMLDRNNNSKTYISYFFTAKSKMLQSAIQDNNNELDNLRKILGDKVNVIKKILRKTIDNSNTRILTKRHNEEMRIRANLPNSYYNANINSRTRQTRQSKSRQTRQSKSRQSKSRSKKINTI